MIRSPAAPALLALAAAMIAAPVQADVSGPLYERTLMLDADRRCGLFDPTVRAALSASRLQARGAAVRARLDASAVERRARLRAAAVPCRSTDLQTAAARVRQAHVGWARLTRMEFPGAASTWRADRTPSAQLRWRLVQASPAAAFGLASVKPAEAAPYAVARLPRGSAPAFARLTVGRRVFLAQTLSRAPETLAGKGPGRSWSFRFPAEAAAALAASPAGGRVSFEVLGSDRRQSLLTHMPIEVGDFTAAQAFLAQPPA